MEKILMNNIPPKKVQDQLRKSGNQKGSKVSAKLHSYIMNQMILLFVIGL